MAKPKTSEPPIQNVSEPEMKSAMPAPRKKVAMSTWAALVCLLVALGCAAAAGYFYWQLQQAKVTAEQAAAQELASVKQRIGNLMVLPTDEEPTLATVSDPEKLRSQPFFASAEAGDQVLIYTKARKAILYRPSINKILEVAPLNLSNTPQATGDAPSTTE